MVKIKNGVDIYYTEGDTFKLTVGREFPFNTGDTLRLQITRTEGATPFINTTYTLINSSGEFDIVLSENDKKKLLVDGKYKYRLSVISVDGNIDTEKSGNFFVEWGV